MNTSSTFSSSFGNIYQVFQGLSTSYPMVVGLIFTFLYVAAGYFMWDAYNRFQAAVDDTGRGETKLGGLFSLCASAFCMYLPGFAQVMQVSLFGAAQASNLMSYQSNPSQITSIGPIMGFIWIVGLIAFIGGGFQLRKYAIFGESGRTTLARGIVLLVSGAIALNFTWFLKVAGNSTHLNYFTNQL
jgi:hypothetical protein